VLLILLTCALSLFYPLYSYFIRILSYNVTFQWPVSALGYNKCIIIIISIVGGCRTAHLDKIAVAANNF